MGAKINKEPSLEAPKEKAGRQQSLEQQNLKKIPNNLAGALTNNNESRVESSDEYRKEVINEIKKTEEESLPAPYYISQIFKEKIEGKTIPDKYLQEIIDEIGKVGACNYVLFNPDEFKGGRIEDCVCSTLKKGYSLRDNQIEQLRRREPFDHIKLLKGMLALNIKEDDDQDYVKIALVDYLQIFYRDGFRKISKEDRKTIPNLILESKYYTLLPGLIGSEFKRAFKPTDEFYKNLKNKICEKRTRLENTPENRRKNLVEYAQATDYFNKLSKTEYKELEEELLDIAPHFFLRNLRKFPGNLENNERILKMLDERLLGSGFTEVGRDDFQHLDLLEPIDADIFNKYIDRLIEAGEWKYIIPNFHIYFGRKKIDVLEKIKKIIKYEKENGKGIRFDLIIDLVSRAGKNSVDIQELAQLFEKEGVDIKKYPEIFGKILYDRDPENIKLLLDTFDEYEYDKDVDGYKVKRRSRLTSYEYEYGFIKDGKIIFRCLTFGEFNRRYQDRRKNLNSN